LGRPGAVARYLVLRYAQRDQEVMGAIYLDTRHRLIAVSEFFRGYAEFRTMRSFVGRWW
jgi:DNA repair protein RadC